MEPISTGMQLAGLGFKLAGFLGGQDSAKEYNETQRQQALLEQAAENERRKQMELMARRQQMEVIRNAQRARSLALQNATNQGAQFGSGLQGGYGQVAADANYNLLGINQNLQIGRALFANSAAQSQNRMRMADARSEMQFWDSLGGLGGQLISSAPMARELSPIASNKGGTFFMGSGSNWFA